MNTRPFTHTAAALAAPFLLGLALTGTAAAGLVRAPVSPARLQASPHPHLAAPKIAIVGASAALQHHCHSPQPLFIVSVTLRNAGGPLAAHHGLTNASEDSGITNAEGQKRLVSHGIALPAIGAHASAVVKIPVQALAPYSELAGSHPLTVHVMPTSYSGKPAFPKPPTYTFRVRVPAGFCLSRRNRPASGGLRPAPGLKLNPQPEPPSRR